MTSLSHPLLINRLLGGEKRHAEVIPSRLPVEAGPSRADKEAILSSGRGTNLAFVQVCVNGSGGSSPGEGNRRAARLLSQHHHHHPTPAVHSFIRYWLTLGG